MIQDADRQLGRLSLNDPATLQCAVDILRGRHAYSSRARDHCERDTGTRPDSCTLGMALMPLSNCFTIDT
jgi:hypothetical protein